MRKKILITVKTYPTLSRKYKELVCTAGITETGEWVRIYPVPFRRLYFELQYKKYQWVEMDIERNARDPRPESYRLLDQDTIKLLDIVGTEKGTWQTRRSLVIKNVYTDMQKLIDAAKDKNKATSLAVFKPKKILDFRIEETDRTWDEAKLAAFRQMELFSANASEAVNKLPYKFSYIFEDENGRQSTLMIEDWEIGQLYWNCLKRRNNNEQKALVDVKKKYLEQFVYASYDIYFFLGTTRGYHFRGKNPFVIVGIFYPKNRH